MAEDPDPNILDALGAILSANSTDPAVLRAAAENALGHPLTEVEAQALQTALNSLAARGGAVITEAMRAHGPFHIA